jgi:hypothetical protein
MRELPEGHVFQLPGAGPGGAVGVRAGSAAEPGAVLGPACRRADVFQVSCRHRPWPAPPRSLAWAPPGRDPAAPQLCAQGMLAWTAFVVWCCDSRGGTTSAGPAAHLSRVPERGPSLGAVTCSSRPAPRVCAVCCVLQRYGVPGSGSGTHRQACVRVHCGGAGADGGRCVGHRHPPKLRQRVQCHEHAVSNVHYGGLDGSHLHRHRRPGHRRTARTGRTAVVGLFLLRVHGARARQRLPRRSPPPAPARRLAPPPRTRARTPAFITQPSVHP